MYIFQKNIWYLDIQIYDLSEHSILIGWQVLIKFV